MNKPTNRRIVEALTLTLRYLSPTGNDVDGRHAYICWALDTASENHRISMKTCRYVRQKIIHARIEGSPLLDVWLVRQGVPEEDLEANDGRALQEHRKAWVKLLIKEFSK